MTRPFESSIRPVIGLWPLEFPIKDNLMEKECGLNADTKVEIGHNRLFNELLCVFWKGYHLGDLFLSESLLEFLNRSGLNWHQKFRKNAGPEKSKRQSWKIEYGLLFAAYKAYRNDAQAFDNTIRKAKNKKELCWLLGIN